MSRPRLRKILIRRRPPHRQAQSRYSRENASVWSIFASCVIPLGEFRLSDISPGAVDRLYASIKIDRIPVADERNQPALDEGGYPILRETPRLRRAQEAMKASRRAWNVA